MPKIDAPTVAEHRANQERALLDAARELLLASGRAAITPAAVGAAAGLARSSVYKYFSSGEEILTRIAAEAFADWGARVSDAVGRAADADGRVDTYVRTTLELALGAHGSPCSAAACRETPVRASGSRRRIATSPRR